MEGFKSGLRDLGWVEGESVCFEIRAAEGQLHLLPGFASELVGLGPNLIAVIGAVTVRAVGRITTRIPIVFAVVVEPIGDGLATNLERPGGNITGITTFDPNQAKTQLELLRAMIPDLKRVAILSDLGVSDCMSRSNREAAHGLQLEAQVIRVEAPSPEYKKAFAAMEHERAQALIVLEEPIKHAGKRSPIWLLLVDCRRYSRFRCSMREVCSLTARVCGRQLGTWHATQTRFSEERVPATWPLRRPCRMNSL